MELNEKLAWIQTKFKSKKSRYNSFGKYNFRSAEDILEATKPYLLELKVSVIIKEQLISTEPFPILETTATISDGANAIHATAIVGIDLQQKGIKAPVAKNTLTSEKDPAYPKAVEFIKKGGKLSAIKAKYNISKEIETKLTTL